MRKYIKIVYMMLFFTTLLFADQKDDFIGMSNTIAVAAVEDAKNSQISEIAGKSPYYLIFDENGLFLQSIKNPGEDSSRDSSSKVVNLLIQKGCKIVIAGQFGNKMQNQLKTNNIQFYEREGIAEDVLQSFIKK